MSPRHDRDQEHTSLATVATEVPSPTQPGIPSVTAGARFPPGQGTLVPGATGDMRTETRIATSHRQVERYEGPIPHPDHLAALAQIDPKLVDRVVSMAEAEQKHRHEIEHHVVHADTRMAVSGQIFGFLAVGIAFGVVAFGWYLGLGAAGATLGSSVIVALAGGFAVRQYSRRSHQVAQAPRLSTPSATQSSPQPTQRTPLPLGKGSRKKRRR